MPPFPKKALRFEALDDLQRQLKPRTNNNSASSEATAPHTATGNETLDHSPKPSRIDANNNNDPAVEPSNHKVIRFTFMDSDNQLKTAFFKPVSEDSFHYPALLNQFAVLASTVMALSIGEQVAQERLVLNNEGQIVGTASIALNGFEPMLGYRDARASTLSSEALMRLNPSTQTLMEMNYAAIAGVLWFCGEDDAHPGNMGTFLDTLDEKKFGVFDRDMSCRVITDCLKPTGSVEKTFGCDRVGQPLKSGELDTLLTETSATHWPSYSRPKNNNIWKSWPSYLAFDALKNNPSHQNVSYHEQLFAALLKILVTFDPDLLEKRLQEDFGEMKPDCSNLTPEQLQQFRERLKTLAPHLTFDSEQTFVELASQIIQAQYDDLYRIVVFYQGKDLGENRRPIDSFRNYLAKHPEQLSIILEWTQKENARLAKETSNVFFHEQRLSGRFYQIWRDAQLLEITKLASDLRNHIRGVAKELASSNTQNEMNEVVLNSDKKDITESYTLFAQIFPAITEITVNSDPKSPQTIALQKTLDLYEYLRCFLAPHFNKTPNELLLELPDDFGNKLERVIIDHSKDFDTVGLKSLTLQTILQRFKDFANQYKLTQNLPDVTAWPSMKPLDHTDTEVIREAINDLFAWIRDMKTEDLKRLICPIIETHRAYKSSRDIEQLLKDVKESCGSNQDLIGGLLSVGSTQPTSLNPKLVTALFEARIKSPILFNPQLLSISVALQQNQFDAAQYAQRLQEFCKDDSQFSHIHSQQFASNLVNEVVGFVGTMEYENFKERVKLSLIEYQGWGFFGGSRATNVKVRMGRNESQQSIFAFIFSEGGNEESSLKTKCFRQILNARKEKAKEEVGKIASGQAVITGVTNQIDSMDALMMTLPSLPRAVEEECLKKLTEKAKEISFRLLEETQTKTPVFG